MSLVWPGCKGCIRAVAAKNKIIKARYIETAAPPDKPGESKKYRRHQKKIWNIWRKYAGKLLTFTVLAV
jgi:hypothetical protein